MYNVVLMSQSQKLFEEFIRLYNTNKSTNADMVNKYRFIKLADKIYMNGKAKDLLDVGCGGGELDSLLSERYMVTGVDIDKNNIASAKKNVKGVRFILGNMLNFDIGMKFDIITCIDAIDHGKEQRRKIGNVLKNMYEHLKIGGILISDLNFLKELWKEGNPNVSVITANKNKYIRIFHKEANGLTGTSYYIILKLRGNRIFAESSSPYKTTDLLELKTIKDIANRIGFSVFMYEGWRGKTLKTIKRTAPVCVFVKRA